MRDGKQDGVSLKHSVVKQTSTLSPFISATLSSLFFSLYLFTRSRVQKVRTPELKGLFDCCPAGETSEDVRSSVRRLCRRMKRRPPAETQKPSARRLFPPPGRRDVSEKLSSRARESRRFGTGGCLSPVWPILSLFVYTEETSTVVVHD